MSRALESFHMTPGSQALLPLQSFGIELHGTYLIWKVLEGRGLCCMSYYFL